MLDKKMASRIQDVKVIIPVEKKARDILRK